ncbi:MAG: hypothetical protein GX757_00030 [Clostridiales bacterium]|nr:hypothetical protein [Clostridiales bacterium]
MIKKKSAFLTFCCSLLPGAGQMYMGFMKRGISLMASFFLLIFLSVWLDLGPLLLVVPIIWFFSFFDTHNLRSMPDDKFYSFQDDYVVIPEVAIKGLKIINDRYRKVIATALIAIGFTLLWNNFLYIFDAYLPSYISSILYMLGRKFPQMLIGIAIITLGIILIRGKKIDLDTARTDEPYEEKGGMI